MDYIFELEIRCNTFDIIIEGEWNVIGELYLFPLQYSDWFYVKDELRGGTQTWEIRIGNI